jgi:hypothetical protein
MTNLKIEFSCYGDLPDDFYSITVNSDVLNVLIGILENKDSSKAQLLYDLTSNEMEYERHHNLPLLSDENDLVPTRYAEYKILADYLEQVVIPYLDGLDKDEPMIKDKDMDSYNVDALENHINNGKYWLYTINELRGIDISAPMISFLAERLVKLYRFSEENQNEIIVY